MSKFRIFKYTFLSWMCFLVVTSCRTTRQEVSKEREVSKLEKKSVTSFRDTILFTPSSLSELKIPISRPSKCKDTVFVPKFYTQKNGNATAEIRIERDTIIVRAKCDSLKLRAQIKHELEVEHFNYAIDKEAEKITKKIYTFRYIVAMALAFMAGVGVAFVSIKTKIL